VKITLLSDEAVRLEQTPGPLTVEAANADMSYSPFHMLASALATCTMSVLHSWATHAKISADDLVIDVGWSFAEKPHRVGAMTLTFKWPSLPEGRREAAKRATTLCAIHATLSHSPEIAVEMKT
jgi:uncharacterized OsmC-like protein